MYSSRGSNSYGQQEQSYPSQSAYTPNLLHSFSGTSVGRAERVSQLSGTSRHSSMLEGIQEGDIGGYRGGHPHPSSGPHLGGQYSSAYGSAAQQVHQMSANGSMPSSLEGRGGFTSSLPDSPRFTSGDYTALSIRGYGRTVEQLYTDRISDYTSGDRHNCADRDSTYMGIDLQSETPARYAESVAFGHKHQPEMYDRMSQSSLLRQEQMLKKQSLPSGSLDGSTRQTDLLPARVNTFHHLSQNHHPSQDATTYSGRIDIDPRSLSILSSSSYGGQQTSSILGAAPQRSVEDLLYVQGSSNPGYGVSLPPGRDYGAGKGLRSLSDAEYTSSMSIRGTRPMVDDYKDDRIALTQELERSEKERFRDYYHEREKDIEREKEWERDQQRVRVRVRVRDRDRDWERDWDQDKGREQERDQERDRDRERERERERETQRNFERREKERERERKHVVDVKRDRTPARLSRERRGSLLTKDGRALQRESPRAEAVHRRHSPERKRRDYICKVCSSSLVEVERDYLSLYKRYPRLFVSPECSKVVVNWPKGNVKLSLYTPVSFEHDFVDDNTVSARKEFQSKLPSGEILKLEHGNTVWNSKVVLMSGLSQNALEELSSGICNVDRIPHFCNTLRFSVLRKNNSLMAIGGCWDPADGGDPSLDDTSLVRTVTRYAKDVAHLHLENCKNWNRFLEIHYDRVGNDGLFSHKEVTVLYVPDISDCLPSLEAWRDQWLAHKKAVGEREQLQSLRKQKSGEKKAGTKEFGMEDIKHVTDPKGELADKKKEMPSTGNPANALDTVDKIETKVNPAEKDEKTDKNVGCKTVEIGYNDLKNEDQQEIVQIIGGPVSGKKKVVKKLVRQRVAKKKLSAEISDKQENDFLNKNVGEEEMADPEGASQHDGSSINISAIKTFKRKKIVKKVIVGKVTERESENVNHEVKCFNEPECSEDKSNSKSDGSSTVVIPDTGVKTALKKKVIKRVPKTKAITGDATLCVNYAGSKKDTKDECVVQDDKAVQVKEAQTSVDNIKQSTEKNIEKNSSSIKETESVNAKKQDKKLEKMAEGELVSGFKVTTDNDTQMICHNDDHVKPIGRKELKGEKESKDKDGKDDAGDKVNKNLQQKTRINGPPRHPGLIIQTKGCRDSKLQSLSLSLDSLLDYNGRDVEESTFELSLFAETLYEMLQYEMGSRLLAFLQRLRVMCASKRNQQKRHRDDSSKNENEEKSSVKRPKEDGITVDVISTKMAIDEDASPNNKRSTGKEDSTSLGLSEGVKMHETDPGEDPEEDPEEDEELLDVALQHDSADEQSAQFGEMSVDENRGNNPINAKNEKEICESAKELTPHLPEGSANKVKTVETKSQVKEQVDKELLQAFRFFDRNRVGYIRVEDMRLIIHNLGKCLSHREVKELVLSALLESNTGKDDRILYDKLVNLSDI